jgi:endosialidase-like protein
VTNKIASLIAVLTVALMLVGVAPDALAQSTAFSYQGKLSDAGSPANGNYDFQFKVFDTATVGTGTQQGSTVAVSNLTVTNGVFSVTLDFGAVVFPGADRFLEIAVKTVAAGSFTTLSPRQPITPTPYAIRSFGASTADSLTIACVSCVTSGQIASVNGSAVTGTIPVASVPAGSGSYIQNTTSQQAASNFNISGNGTLAGTLSANIVNTQTQYNIGANRVLSAGGTANIFAGVGAGSANTGSNNAFFGSQAGLSNSTGNANSFFGTSAGLTNTTGAGNSFFGSFAGFFNTTGAGNSFFGNAAGETNTTGGSNSFFGALAGQDNTTGGNNSFFGNQAGFLNTTGNSNSFFGATAGFSNSTGIINAFFGSAAGFTNSTGGSNSFFGGSAGHDNSTGTGNSFFGHEAGISNTTADGNSFFGNRVGNANTTGFSNSFFGAFAGNANSTGSSNVFSGFFAAALNTTGSRNVILGSGAGGSNTTENENSFIGYNANGAAGITNATSVGAKAQVTQSNSLVLGSINGTNGATADTNVGIGTSAPAERLHVVGNAIVTGTLNVSGTLNVASQYNIGASRVLSNAGSGNLFAGVGAGSVNTGGSNAFFGSQAGFSNSTGNGNSFFGTSAGFSNSTGGTNAFFGTAAGFNNSTGSANSFFGNSAGHDNTIGTGNSFFGHEAGLSNTADGNSFFGNRVGNANTTGFSNSFFGAFAGSANSTGTGNSFLGASAGNLNTTGSRNLIVGSGAGASNTTENENSFLGYNATGAVGITNATTIGARAQVTQSNSLVLGSINGTNGATADTSVGIGTTAPGNPLDVIGAGTQSGGVAGFSEVAAHFRQRSAGNHLALSIDALTGQDAILYLAENGSAAWGIRNDSDQGAKFQVRFHGGGANNAFLTIQPTGEVGIGTVTPQDRLDVNGIIRVATLGAAGSTSLCRNASNQIAACSSSVRYKTALRPFTGGLDLINRLHPISFTWKDGGMRDVGLGAEDVAKVEPLLVTRNAGGEIEGVKYDRINVVLINAVKEQQALIAELQKQIQELKSFKAESDTLKTQLTAVASRLERLERKKARRK